ncbi:hypothetical protein AGMMS50268_26260 [Spirochaetia bacterium]|nr:hypothetical protein AGMMS50268_26260 [Spirochaetia bacterium]
MIQALHSRYNPRLEAEKYINTLNLTEAEYLILIEPGLGYMIPLLGEKYPAARILALHVEDQKRAAENSETLPDSGSLSWTPESGVDPEEFLGQIIPDRPASAIRLIEWRPALVRYGESYLRLLAAAANFIKRSDANFRTVKNFGGRWFRNFFKNLGLLQSFPVYEKIRTPLAITGSGPGLEESLPLIAALKQQGRLFILAASSSAAALLSRGITPDLVISTDGGPWALLHLYECFRAGTAPRPPAIAAALSAALPSQCAYLPLLCLSDGSLWQSLVLQRLKVPHIPMVQRGTVSASAIDLALQLGGAEVLIAGMDLAVRDIRSHVRPYSFDRLLTEGASRLNPVYSRAYARSAGISGGGSHQIYASWFAGQIKAYPGRLYTLGSNNQVFQGLPNWTETDMISARALVDPPSSSPHSSARITQVKLPEDPAGFALRVLTEALSDPRITVPVREELSALLFPGKSNVGAAELVDEIRGLAGPYGGVHG